MVLFARPSGSAPGPITPPRRQRDAGWFRPPHHAHPSRVPLQSCAAPHALRRRADGIRGFPRVACPRAAGASYSTCPRRWWSAARRCARRLHDPRKIMRRAITQKMSRPAALHLPSPAEGPTRDPMTRRQARPRHGRADLAEDFSAPERMERKDVGRECWRHPEARRAASAEPRRMGRRPSRLGLRPNASG